MAKYSQGICQDGAAILLDGGPITIEQIIESLRELEVTNTLLEERQQVLDAIPECEVHGKCIPHALEWIEKAKASLAQ